MRKILLLAAIAVAALLAYVSADVDLSPVAERFSVASQPSTKSPSRAYRIALGMYASFEDDAYEIGSKTISAYAQADEGMSLLGEFEFSGYPEDKQPYFPTADDSELYCLIRESGCLAQILIDASGREAERIRLETLVDRYDQYLHAGDYRTEIVPTQFGPFPKFRYAYVGQRMNVFAAMHAAENGDEAGAVNGLLEDLQLLRQLLAISDDLLHKAITVAMIRDQLESVAFIHRTFEAPFVLPIKPLTSEEIDFEEPLLNEFGIIYRLATFLDGHPNLLSHEIEVPTWLSNLVFPANKVINTAAEQAEIQINLSKLDPPEFAESVGNNSVDAQSFYSIIPSVNEASIEMADIDYKKFVAQAFDLNAKIELVNAQITGDPEAVTNPYYPESEVVLTGNQDDDSDLRFCMDGPLPDNRGGRCLDVHGLHEQLISLIAEEGTR